MFAVKNSTNRSLVWGHTLSRILALRRTLDRGRRAVEQASLKARITIRWPLTKGFWQRGFSASLSLTRERARVWANAALQRSCFA